MGSTSQNMRASFRPLVLSSRLICNFCCPQDAFEEERAKRERLRAKLAGKLAARDAEVAARTAEAAACAREAEQVHLEVDGCYVAAAITEQQHPLRVGMHWFQLVRSWGLTVVGAMLQPVESFGVVYGLGWMGESMQQLSCLLLTVSACVPTCAQAQVEVMRLRVALDASLKEQDVRSEQGARQAQVPISLLHCRSCTSAITVAIIVAAGT